MIILYRHVVLFKIKGKQLDVNAKVPENVSPTRKRRSITNSDTSDKVGDVVILRTEKHFVIKVTNIRLIKKGEKSISLVHSNDYIEQLKNTIVMSLKQGMKLLIDCDHDYLKIWDKLYYKFGRLMLAN